MRGILALSRLALFAVIVAPLPGASRECAAESGPRSERLNPDASARDEVGHDLHKQMLAAFSYDRDYAKTLELAQKLSRPSFDGFEYQARARELAEQLPRRSTDFQSFRLPAPEEWAQRKTSLSRKEQIDFLAERLRLLNCFQWGQPGGVDFEDPQYEEASHMKAPFDMTANASRVLINPYRELRGMNLAASDVPDLLRWVEDRNFTLTFSFWRDFAWQRELYRVADIVAGLINGIAQRVLVDAEKLASLTGEPRTTYLGEIREWSASHGASSPAALRVERLREATDQPEFLKAVGAVRVAKDVEAAPVLVERANDFPPLRAYVAEALYATGSAQGLELARNWSRESITRRADDRGGMEHFSAQNLRFWSSMLVLRDGDRSSFEGRDALEELLTHDRGLYWTQRAIDLLVPMGEGLSIAAYCAIAKQPLDFSRMELGATLRRLMDYGCRKEVVESLTAALQDFTATGSFHYPPEDPKRGVRLTNADFATTIVRGWRDGAPTFPPPRTLPSTPEERQALREWLQARG